MYNDILENVKKVIVGKDDVIEKLLVVMFSRGHVLIEDVPGVGKTTIAKAISKSVDCSFGRIQFTPDLLPSDIIGVSIFDKKNNQFVFRKGPVHNQIILADEINRASPKTQSSLLEVMEERQITVDGQCYKFESPFMVIATQNPVEFEGTFPLPEAQLDRFMMKIAVGYPEKADEVKILSESTGLDMLESLDSVIDRDAVVEIQRKVDKVFVDEKIKTYIVDLTTKTREYEEVNLGCSPRGSINLYRAVKARAYIKNRDYVIPEDVKSVAVEVLAHRIILSPEARYRGVTKKGIIERALMEVKVQKVEHNE